MKKWLDQYQLGNEVVYNYTSPVLSDNTFLERPIINKTKEQFKKEAEQYAFNQRVLRDAYPNKFFTSTSNPIETIEKNLPYTLPNGQRKTFDKMNWREKNYVRGNALKQRGKINKLPDALNPVQWVGDIAGNLAQAPYEAQQSNSILPYLTAIATPLVMGRSMGSGSINPISKKFWTNEISNAEFLNNMALGVPNLTKNAIKNIYNLNPSAIKENPEMFLYRVRPVGQNPDMNMAAQLRAKQAAGEPLTWYQKNLLNPQTNSELLAREKYYGQWFEKDPNRLNWYIDPATRNFADNDAIEILRTRLPKSEAAKLNISQFPDAKVLSASPETEFILPKNMIESAERFPESSLQQLIQEHKKFNTPHWLRGFSKEVPKPTSNINLQLFGFGRKKPIVSEVAPLSQLEKQALVTQEDLARANRDAITFSQSPANRAKLQEFRPGQDFSITNQQARFIDDPEALKLYESYKLENDPSLSIEQYLGGSRGQYGARDYGDLNDVVLIDKNQPFTSNIPSRSAYTDAMHETTHSRSIRLGATDAEKEIASDAWSPMIKKNNFGMPEEEAFAVQNELRTDKLKDIKGDRVYTEKDIPEIKKGLQEMITEGHDYLRNVNIEDFNIPALIKSLNKIGLGAVVLGVAGKEALQKKKKGGVIKDNRGQWAHPGKPTRISSPNITMEGVPYPVLAKANNGMTTMMYPEQDYYFPGANYVDEYPMMQNGGEKSDLERVVDKTSDYLGSLWRSIGKGLSYVTPDYESVEDRELLFKRYRPVKYPGITTSLLPDKLKPFTDKQGDYNVAEEAWRKALGLKTKDKYLIPSKYKPLNEKNKNSRYYTLNQDIIDPELIRQKAKELNLKPGSYQLMDSFAPFVKKEFMNSKQYSDIDPMQKFKLGVNKNGKVYIYDKYDFDFEPLQKVIRPYEYEFYDEFKHGGEMIKRADGSYSRRGLWDTTSDWEIIG